MKFISLLIFLITIGPQLTDAQPKHNRLFGPPDKIKELEKVKLLEVLDMDEETTLKFFTRRNEHLKKMEELNKSCDDELSKIEEKIKSSENENDPEFIKLVDDYLAEQDKFNAERRVFLNSVKDILTPIQLAKLVVFEQRFREEIREILYRDKRKGMK